MSSLSVSARGILTRKIPGPGSEGQSAARTGSRSLSSDAQPLVVPTWSPLLKHSSVADAAAVVVATRRGDERA